MKQRIKLRDTFPDTVEKMQEAVQDRLEHKDWNWYIDSTPDIFRQAKERKVMQTQY